MDTQTYEGLIRQLEAKSENNPAWFRSQVFLMTNCAYLVLLCIFALVIGLIYLAYKWQQSGNSGLGLLVGSAVAIIPAIYVSIKAFFIRFDAPKGFELTPKNAPELFKVLGKMRKKLKGPPFHHVILNNEFNAAIVQMPRWGLFGGYKNHLILGLPYMLGMSPIEMISTIAHEYGHVAGNHGKLGAWVYRQRITFGELSRHLENSKDDGIIQAGIYAAIDAFTPYFNAYTFVLSRQDEYDADKTATELVGAKANAASLIRGDLLGNWIHTDFWSTLYKQANQHVEPIFKPYASMQKAFASNYDVWATPAKLQVAWRVQSDLHDTHPCLSDRVLAAGEKPVLPPPVTQSAAQALIGNILPEAIKKFDADWWAHEKAGWQKYHHRAISSRARIQSLSQTAPETLNINDLHELALLSVEFETTDKAKPLLALVLSKSSGNYSKAEFEYGKILLSEKNDAGLAYLEKAAIADKALTEVCTHTAYYYLLEYKGEAAAGLWWEKIYARID